MYPPQIQQKLSKWLSISFWNYIQPCGSSLKKFKSVKCCYKSFWDGQTSSNNGSKHPANYQASNQKQCLLRSSRREMGWRRVKKARSSSTDKKVRKFDIPVINFYAKEYTELINWQDTPVTEPPITKRTNWWASRTLYEIRW